LTEKIKYWLELSEYDLETAGAMLRSQRFLYVGFMCHQTIEKIFKAYFIKNKNETPPYSHALSYIAKTGGFYDDFIETQKDFIDHLEPLNIEARYPAHKERLLKSLTLVKCQELLTKTIELHSWIKRKL
jgi:HEPN domain-containing protein